MNKMAPTIQEPLIKEDGTINELWYKFLVNNQNTILSDDKNMAVLQTDNIYISFIKKDGKVNEDGEISFPIKLSTTPFIWMIDSNVKTKSILRCEVNQEKCNYFWSIIDENEEKVDCKIMLIIIGLIL